MARLFSKSKTKSFTVIAPEHESYDAARGLIIGLAVSQVFWIALAYFIF